MHSRRVSCSCNEMRPVNDGVDLSRVEVDLGAVILSSFGWTGVFQNNSPCWTVLIQLDASCSSCRRYHVFIPVRLMHALHCARVSSYLMHDRLHYPVIAAWSGSVKPRAVRDFFSRRGTASESLFYLHVLAAAHALPQAPRRAERAVPVRVVSHVVCTWS